MTDFRCSTIHLVVESDCYFDIIFNPSELVWHVGDGLLI